MHEMKDKRRYIQRGAAELNGASHLSPNAKYCSIARKKTIHFFVLYNTSDVNGLKTVFLGLNISDFFIVFN